MSLLEFRVVIFENNATRADLYEHWLSEYDVRSALTRREAVEAFDGTVAVAILDEGFADGAAETVLEMVRARNPDCRVLTTAEDRGQVFPSLDVKHHLAKPIFEEELRERVDRLARQALYSSTIKRYYSLTVELTSVEIGEDDPETARERRDRLEAQLESLKSRLATITRTMDADDFHSAMDELVGDEPAQAPEGKQDSKYVPTKCSKCGQSWTGEDSADPVRLGSFVWRCTECGHVQMHGDPKEGKVAQIR